MSSATVSNNGISIQSTPEINLTTPADRRADIDSKQAHLAALLQEVGCDGLLILDPVNLAWLTSGGAARGVIDPNSAPALYFSPEGRWVLCANVDSQRFFDEEVDGLGFQLKEWPWHWGRDQLLADLIHGRRVAADMAFGECVEVSEQLRQLRRTLTPYEQACFRALGQLLAHALEACCRTLMPGDTEREVAGQLSHRLLHRGVQPLHLTVLADGRSTLYRQAGFTSAPVKSSAVLLATAQKYGLYAMASRSVTFSNGDPSFRKEHDIACRVAATYTASTWPDALPKQIMATAQRVYQITGAEHEWRLCPQGHITGRMLVEQAFTLKTSEMLQANWAITWRATVGSGVSCDTFLITEDGPRTLTAPENWPMKRIRVQGGRVCAAGCAGAMIPPAWLWPRAAYLHIPFCAHHCGYCDFAIAVGHDDRTTAYLDALEAELRRLGSPQPVETLFIGGGTPTHLEPAQLERLLQLATHWFPLLPGGEFSIEANPNNLDREKIQLLAAHGVNRISLGVQSFQPALLQALERQHDPADVFRAVELCQEQMESFSLDLIFGVPGQTLALWQHDLEQALALGPDHISTYGLTFEKGTPLWKRQQQGLVQSLEEETELALYLCAMDILEATGFEHYEISNFARPGYRSRHNQVYWANHAYFGAGMGAARYLTGCREVNTRDLGSYIRKALAGEPLAFQSEQLEPEDRARETIGQNLRRREGVLRQVFQEQTGFTLDELAGRTVTQLVELGLLEDDGASVHLTRQGKCVADAVTAEFWKG